MRHRLIGAGMILVGAAAGVMSASAAQPGSAAQAWKLVHPDAKWILGVEWARARNSAAAQILQRQFEGAKAKVESSGLGFGALTSIERILVSGTALELAGSDAPEGFVAVIEGRIDRTRLKRELPPGTAVEKFRGADLFVPPKAARREPLLAVVSDSLMLRGDRESPGLVLGGRTGAQDAELAARAVRLAGESEIWMVAGGWTGRRAGNAGGMDPLQGLERVEMGVSLREGVHLTGLLTADSEQSAQGLSGMLQFAGVMGGDNPAAGWLRRLQVETKGNELALALHLPAAELERGIQAGKAAVQQAGRQWLKALMVGDTVKPPEGVRPAVRAGGGAAGSPGVIPLPEALPAPKVRTIRIVGAEDGPKEIQYTAAGHSSR